VTDPSPPDLAALELFADVEPSALAPLADRLTVGHHRAGEVLIHQGDPGGTFLVVLTGSLVVSRADGGATHEIARVGPGSILGELSMLTGRARHADVTAAEDVWVAIGDEEAFELLLELPSVHDRIAAETARRLAAIVRPVPTVLRDGTAVVLRPLVAADRAELVSAIDEVSTETLRRRFFTPGRPSERVIDHLVNINYLDHFAWRVALADHDQGVATARYVRLRDDPGAAEVAFGVVDAHQGRGLGTLLLGALAAAASNAGISRFVAEVLIDNLAMRAVFDKAGATWSRGEAGVVGASIDVAAAGRLIDDELYETLRAVSREVVTGGGLALARPAG
jgi:CRP-like cAMP-binding protein